MKVRATVRFREEWELQCPMCLEYLPIDHEFWEPRRGMNRCRACWRTHTAATKRALYHASPEYAEYKRKKAREYRMATGYESFRSRERWRVTKNDPILLEQHREKNRMAQRRLRERRRQERAA